MEEGVHISWPDSQNVLKCKFLSFAFSYSCDSPTIYHSSLVYHEMKVCVLWKSIYKTSMKEMTPIAEEYLTILEHRLNFKFSIIKHRLGSVSKHFQNTFKRWCKEELIFVFRDYRFKIKLEMLPIDTFWIYIRNYLLVTKNLQLFWSSFPISYLCELGFSYKH